MWVLETTQTLLCTSLKNNHNNLTDEEWRKLCFSPFVNTQLRRATIVVEKDCGRRHNQKGKRLVTIQWLKVESVEQNISGNKEILFT